MTDYTKTTDFETKDSLSSGDPNKIILGQEIDDEFDAIATMSATKADKKIPAAASNVALLDGNGNLADGGKGVPSGTIVGTSDSQTLTNKTISSASNTITIDADVATVTNIKNADIKAGAAIDATKIHDGTVSNTEFGYLNGVTSAIQTQINAKLTDGTGVITSDKILNGTIATGDLAWGRTATSASIPAGSNTTIGAGLYMYYSTFVQAQVNFSTLGWTTMTTSGYTGLVFSDGTNSRWHNTDGVSARTVYYVQLA